MGIQSICTPHCLFLKVHKIHLIMKLTTMGTLHAQATHPQGQFIERHFFCHYFAVCLNQTGRGSIAYIFILYWVNSGVENACSLLSPCCVIMQLLPLLLPSTTCRNLLRGFLYILAVASPLFILF